MGKCKSKKELPFHVRRVISGYRPQLRDAIGDAIRERFDSVKAVGRDLTLDDINECIGSAVGELAGGGRNSRMEQLSLDAYHNGDYQPLREVINELRAS